LGEDVDYFGPAAVPEGLADRGEGVEEGGFGFPWMLDHEIQSIT